MPLEIPQLDDRSFDQLVAEVRARVPVHTPEWTNLNDSDPGMTVVQLFAFMTENLLYRSNRIPEANRLKFLSLLGVPLQPAVPARGIVTFSNERGPVVPWPVDAGTEVRAGKVPFQTSTALCILPITASVFYKQPKTDMDAETLAQYRLLYDSFLDSDTDQLQFYRSTPLEAPQTGKPPPVVNLADTVNGTIDRSLWVALTAPPNVPVDTVRAAIAGQTLALGIYPDDQCANPVLPPQRWVDEPSATPDPGLIFEIAAPDPGTSGGGGIGPARYQRLNATYAENVLEKPGIVEVELPRYEKLLLWDFDPEEEGTGDYPPLVEDKNLAQRIITWIRIRLPQGDDATTGGTSTGVKRQTRLSWVGINAARVIQAVTIQNEVLGIGTGAPNQTYAVANRPIILPAAADASQGSLPSTLVVQVQDTNATGWDTWQLTDDLFAAGPNDAVYAVDPESGQISFGSGLRGLRPPLGRPIRASYQYGGGMQGMVAIGAINKSGALPGGFSVQNALPTWGAGSGEDVSAGEQNIPRYLKHHDRLVTATDFRDITLRTPGVDVGRVEILPLFNPELYPLYGPTQTWPGTVTVMVIPRSDAAHPDAPVPDRLFLDEVCQWLDPRRLVTTEIYVRGPQYVGVWVSVGIVTMAGHERQAVKRDVQAAIRQYLSPLIGGPPVPGAPNLDSSCALPTAADPCGPTQGTGWPLDTGVRAQDLEAVATRVPGVRYVDSIKLGFTSADGATVADASMVPIAGLQLPRLDGISVAEGPAEDIAALLGPPAPPGNQVPVPILPKKC